ncbi:MAG TPA: pitrilysin family protein [Bacillota bacterium]
MELVMEDVISVNGYHLHLIQTKKFKTLSIVAKFKAPLQRETITKRALLPYLLQQGPKNYPNQLAFQTKLDDLYGAVFSIDGSKKGNNHIISFRLDVANQKYISNESSILAEAVKLFRDVIFNPNVRDHQFDETIFNREIETLRKKITSIYDDKLRYANMRLIDEMCEGESYQIHVHGYEGDLETMTAEDVYEYYQSMLHNDQLDIYVVGDFDKAPIKNLFTSMIKRKENHVTFKEDNQVSEQEKIRSKRPKEVIEKQAVQQAKLHIGYRTDCTFKDDDYSALQVMNGILGGFPSSKLFINVREKNSLAYYAASRIESHKGLVLIFSGIDPADYKRAKEIISLQVQAIKNGEFTDVELTETKQLLLNQFLETMDHPQGIIELLYQQVIAQKQLTPKELLEHINDVTTDDVIRVSQKLTEDTTYLLMNEKEN